MIDTKPTTTKEQAMAKIVYAIRSNWDGHILPSRFTEAEAAAALRLRPELADNTGDVTLIVVAR